MSANTPICHAAYLVASVFFASMLAAQGLHTIHAGKPNENARNQQSHMRSLAAAADGSLWCLIYRKATPTTTDTQLLVMRSGDAGKNWTQVAEAPTKRDTWGACVTGANGKDLHVTWRAFDSAAGGSLYYQTLDTRTGKWNGAPSLLLQGQNANHQYIAHDIEITPAGTIVISGGNHRQSPSWSGYLLVKKPGQPWSKQFQLNVGTYGPNSNLQAIGEIVHIAYRSSLGGYGIFYRAFDTVSMKFLQAMDVPVGPNKNQNQHASNICHIVADASDNLYILWSNGASTPGQGKIWMSYASAGNYMTWTQTLLINDPPLKWGNNANRGYSLGIAPGGLVYAIYSKASEQYQNLYIQMWSTGKKVGPEIPVSRSTEINRFQWVNGFRSTQVNSSLMATTSSPFTATQGSVTRFFLQGTPARTLAFGAACSNASTGAPVLDSSNVPVLGSRFVLTVKGMPKSSPGFLLVGTRCQLPALSLGFLGRPNCFLYQDIVVPVPYQSNAQGDGSVSLQLAKNPFWIGATVLFQSYVPHASGGLTTNALAVTLY